MRRWMVFTTLCLILCSSGWAQDAKVTELLDKLPANGSEEGQKIAAEFVTLGPAGIKQIIGMLAPWSGQDEKVQMALSGLAMYVSRPGADTERKMLSDVVIEALGAATDNEVKAFLIRTLQLAGKDEAVAPLAALLTDDRLCDPATQALLAIRTPEAFAVLVKALLTAQGGRRVTIIRALGEARVKEAVGEIIKDATSEDANIRRTAWYALANIGGPSAANVLSKAAQATSVYEKSVGTTCYLLFAKRLAETGNKEQCASICRDLLKTRTAPEDKNVQCAALGTLVNAVGKDAMPEMLAAMDSENKEIREAATELVRALPGEDVTAKCVEKMKTAGPETRVTIIGMLARRGDKSALPALLEAMKDKEQVVRLAAIPAAARLGGNDALTALLAVFETDQADDVKAAQEALMRLPGEEALKAAAEALPKVPPASRIALLNVLAARRAKAQAEAVFAATKDENQDVRREAIKALGEVASEKDIPRLVDLMIGTKDAGDQAAAQKTIATTARRISDPEKRADALLAALDKATGEQRGLLLRTMAQVGGKKALETVIADTKSADATIQDAAVRALTEWTEAAAAPELLNIARSAQKPVHQVLALRGYVRIAGAADLPPDKKVAMLSDAMAAAKRPEEKKLVLAGLSEVKTVEALRAAAAYVDDPVLQTEAVAAVIKIASPKDKKDKGLTGPEVGTVLRKILPLIKDENLRKQAEEQLGACPLPDKLNLACGKPVKVSVPPQGNRTPELAVDGNSADLNSAWFGAKWPCTFEVDLQKPEKIDTVQVFFYWDGSRYYEYTVDASADGKTWKPIVDNGKNTTPASSKGVLHTLPATEARYVRLNILKNSVNEAVHLVELKVYAEGTAPKPPPPPKPDAEGFIPLFNGKDLTGWAGAVNGYDAVDGILVCDEKRGGYLRTEDEYSNFIFRFEFKLTPGGNNGVAIRTPPGGHAAYDGMEIQILDNTAKQYEKLQPYQFHGSIYGVVPAKREFLKPVGEWNSEEIVADGPHITVTLNGTVIVDADLSKIEEPMDQKKHPGIKRDKGFIGFLGHGSHVEFRNIRIKELK